MIAKISKWFYNLNFDAVSSALCLSQWIHLKYSQDFSLTQNLLLALAVWMVYSIDHLGSAQNPQERHIFHWKNKKNFKTALIFSFFISLALCFYLPKSLLLYGLLIGLAVVFYLILFSYLKIKVGLAKETAIALLFSMGCSIAVWVNANFEVQWTVFLLCFLLVFGNLLLCEYLENQDKKHLRVVLVLVFFAIFFYHFFKNYAADRGGLSIFCF